MKFLLTGGGQRERAVWSQEWKHYELAMLVSLDWDTGKAERVIEYSPPPRFLAERNANRVFKAGSLVEDTLYLCTQTEVLSYEYPSLDLKMHLSLPCFNDLHHVNEIGGQIVVVSTGLDMVIAFNKKYEPIKYLNTLGYAPWSKFSNSVDYRKIVSTKPHGSHPNFVFALDNELWVTRFEQRDAVCLADMSKKINIGTERVHDGVEHAGSIYFTTVNGTVVKVDKETKKILETYDINVAAANERPLGWCRGLHVEGERIFVCFSSLRSTKLRENLVWVKRGFKDKKENMRALPTRVVEYDISKRSIVREIDVSAIGMDAIFSLIRVR